MIKELLSMYRPSYSRALVYMLQSTEYQAKPYLAWVWRTKDFSAVMQRRELKLTRPARLLLLALRTGIALEILAGVLLIVLGLTNHVSGGVAFGLALTIAYPLIWPYLIVIPLILGRWFINGPAATQAINQSSQIFADHPGLKIAVAGSYGKTTMKELLKTVLGAGLKVAATPANKNVSLSHAQFAKSLTGKEDVLIIEYGEGAPGDVARFARVTQPTHGIITGLAPAHLDQYKTVEAAGQDIFSLATYLGDKNVYVNDEPEAIKVFLKPSYSLYNRRGALGWQVKDVKVSLAGLDFTLNKDKTSLELHSDLVGRHQLGYLAFVAAFALALGASQSKVKAGLAKTKPFEHRLQPYQLNDAWVIDDTYNGNLEGIRAGTELLKELKAKRKIYVSPGLVDQGPENERVHVEMGELIAEAKPDIVVLMKNSVTGYIKQGLTNAGFKAELIIEDQPLQFYTNLNHFVASGDLLLMQNDWTDNYA